MNDPNPVQEACDRAERLIASRAPPSFLADGKWAELRHLPLAIGFVGAWSMPIKSAADGRVLGTFGTYYRQERQPTPHEVAAVKALAEIAASAIDGTVAS